MLVQANGLRREITYFRDMPFMTQHSFLVTGEYDRLFIYLIQFYLFYYFIYLFYYVMLCYVMLCYVMLCYVCYVIATKPGLLPRPEERDGEINVALSGAPGWLSRLSI